MIVVVQIANDAPVVRPRRQSPRGHGGALTLAGLAATGRWSSTATTVFETCRHGPRADSKPSDSPASMTMSTRSPTGRPPGSPPKAPPKPERRVGHATRSDVPTRCRDSTIGDMRAKVVDGGWDVCVVTDCDGMAIGRIDKSALDANPHQRAVDVMEPGPAQQPPPTPRRADAHPERTTCHRHHPTTRAHRDTHQRRGRPPFSPETHLSETGETANAVRSGGPPSGHLQL